MPKESTTWLRTSALVGLTPIARTTSAGIIVIARRTQQRDADVDEAGHHDLSGVGADARGGGAGGEQRDRERERGGAADEVAELRVGVLDRARARTGRGVWNSLAATASIAMLTRPARPSAMTTSRRSKRSTRLRSSSSRHGMRPLVSAECR